MDGQKLSVYTEGSGAHTLVFLQGGGYPCPILEAKSLYSKLSGDYRIVVIERPGYGFSSEPDRLIPLAEELELERSALGQLGIAGPYILVPHSASGIESQLWAGKYPDEVEAIVGLDMSVPAYYHAVYALDQMEILRNSNLLLSEIQFAMMKELGFARFYDLNEVLDAFRTGELTDDDKAVYKAVAYKIYFNKSMMEGTLSIAEDVKAAESVQIPDIPILMFISDGAELGLEDASAWITMQENFAQEHHAETIQLNCGHNMQNIEQERIAAEMKRFIENLGDVEGK